MSLHYYLMKKKSQVSLHQFYFWIKTDPEKYQIYFYTLNTSSRENNLKLILYIKYGQIYTL